jgi:DNA-directed RNA polymerase specialized sigma subunit
MNRGLVDCFKKLTEKAQKVMVLRFDADLTTEAIGKIVGGSKQYIGRLITQSLEAMRNCLERRHDI